MKKVYLLVTTLLLGVSICKPMENDASRATCKKVEQISPNASPATYIKVVSVLRNKGLSVCDCIKQLSEDRINAQKPALEQEWKISEQTWKDIDAITQKIKKHDNQPGKTVIDINRESFPDQYLPYFTQENVRNLENRFRQAGCNNSSIEVTYEPNATAQIEHINKSRFIYILKLGALFFDGYSQEGKQGILVHEINGHVAHNDPIRGNLLSLNACIYNPELFEPNNQKHFSNSLSMLSMDRAIEARADQNSASTNLTNVRLVEKAFIEAKNIMDNAEYNPDPNHDSIDKRLAMATRIRKLKEAEEYVSTPKTSFLVAFTKFFKQQTT